MIKNLRTKLELISHKYDNFIDIQRKAIFASQFVKDFSQRLTFTNIRLLNLIQDLIFAN